MRRVIIVGRSSAALEEYQAACTLCEFDDILVIGEMGVYFPDRIDHWVSFHPEKFDFWARQRGNKNYPPATQFWSAIYRGKRLGGTKCHPLRHIECVGGSSGFMAVCIALYELCSERVVLAGVPMTPEGAHFGVEKPWKEANRYWPIWIAHLAMLKGKVKSMSGRTRGELGQPTVEWLSG